MVAPVTGDPSRDTIAPMRNQEVKLAFGAALGRAASDKRIEILGLVARVGSISQAARDAGVSYKAAWQALDMLTNLAGVPLVERAVGGTGGGGARLTEAGRQLLAAAGAVDRAMTQTLDRLADAGDEAPAAARLAVRTSMRNQLPCRLAQLRVQGPLAIAVLDLSDGSRLAARITRESAELLGLRPGLPLIALFKATAVTVGRMGSQSGAATCNRLTGKVRRITRGDETAEITVELAGGQVRVVGFAPGSTHLRSGQRVDVDVSESAVVLALPA